MLSWSREEGGQPDIYVLAARPSRFGEQKNERDRDKEGREVFYGPKVPFVCPECTQNFGDDPEALGVHLVNTHEPYEEDITKFHKPTECGKGCGRLLDKADGDAVWHEKLCSGESHDSKVG